jgi:hypothetical protein
MSIEAHSNSQAMRRTGWILSGIVIAFIGGAITSHLRVAGTLTPEMIVSLTLGVTAWGGLWFRDPRIRALIPAVHSAALADASRSCNRAIS